MGRGGTPSDVAEETGVAGQEVAAGRLWRRAAPGRRPREALGWG